MTLPETYEEEVERMAAERFRCGRCGAKEAETRYSLGLYAGVMCGPCWKKSGYRDEGPEGFDPSYAGERYEDDY